MTLQELLSELGIAYRSHGEHHHVTQGWVNIDCPFCSPKSDRFRLGINIQNKYTSCWTCGFHKLAESLSRSSGRSIGEILDLLKGIGFDALADRARRPTGRLRVPNGIGSFSAPHNMYLIGRGFNPVSIAAVWGVRGIGMSANLSWRLWIPIHLRGEIVSWTTRALGDKVQARYINAPKTDESVPSGHCVYGIDHVRHAAIICEGPMDVWAVGPGAVATLGAVVSSEQVETLSEIPIRVVMFDRDANERAARLSSDLDGFKGRTEWVSLETGNDPADADPKEIESIRRKYLE